MIYLGQKKKIFSVVLEIWKNKKATAVFFSTGSEEISTLFWNNVFKRKSLQERIFLALPSSVSLHQLSPVALTAKRKDVQIFFLRENFDKHKGKKIGNFFHFKNQEINNSNFKNSNKQTIKYSTCFLSKKNFLFLTKMSFDWVFFLLLDKNVETFPKRRKFSEMMSKPSFPVKTSFIKMSVRLWAERAGRKGEGASSSGCVCVSGRAVQDAAGAGCAADPCMHWLHISCSSCALPTPPTAPAKAGTSAWFQGDWLWALASSSSLGKRFARA